MPPGNGIIAPANPGVWKPPPKIVVGPQNVGLPGYRPGDPNPGGGPGTIPYPAAPPAPPPPPPPAAPPAAPVPPPIDWQQQVEQDPEGRLQQNYLDRQNDMTTEALKRAWLGHTQSAQDSFNAHGGLFSGAQQQARENIKDDYGRSTAEQQLTYDRGSHDIHTSVLHRLIKQLTGVDDGMGA